MFKVKPAFADNHVFVNGNTKFLKDCNDDDIAILISNGRRNWFVKKTEEIEGGNSDDVDMEDVIPVQTRSTPPKKKPVKKVTKKEATVGAAAE